LQLKITYTHIEY